MLTNSSEKMENFTKHTFLTTNLYFVIITVKVILYSLGILTEYLYYHLFCDCDNLQNVNWSE